MTGEFAGYETLQELADDLEDAMELDIRYPEGTALYHVLTGDDSPCAVAIDLVCDGRLLTMDWLRGDEGIPTPLFHRRWLRWPAGPLTEANARKLLDEIAPLCSTICDGFDTEWDGSNTVGVLTDAARAASEKVEEICERYIDSELYVRGWSAFAWHEAAGRRQTAADYGLMAGSTDDDLSLIADRMRSDALESGACDVLFDVDRYCEFARRELQGGE